MNAAMMFHSHNGSVYFDSLSPSSSSPTTDASLTPALLQAMLMRTHELTSEQTPISEAQSHALSEFGIQEQYHALGRRVLSEAERVYSSAEMKATHEDVCVKKKAKCVSVHPVSSRVSEYMHDQTCESVSLIIPVTLIDTKRQQKRKRQNDGMS